MLEIVKREIKTWSENEWKELLKKNNSEFTLEEKINILNQCLDKEKCQILCDKNNHVLFVYENRNGQTCLYEVKERVLSCLLREKIVS